METHTEEPRDHQNSQTTHRQRDLQELLTKVDNNNARARAQNRAHEHNAQH